MLIQAMPRHGPPVAIINLDDREGSHRPHARADACLIKTRGLQSFRRVRFVCALISFPLPPEQRIKDGSFDLPSNRSVRKSP
jgi:hypothetical protein